MRRPASVGSRKLWVVLTTLLMSFVLALLGKMSAEWATVATVAMAAFSAANAVEHLRKGPPL